MICVVSLDGPFTYIRPDLNGEIIFLQKCTEEMIENTNTTHLWNRIE